MNIPTLGGLAAVALLTLSACGNSSSTTAQQPAETGTSGAVATTGLRVAQTSLGKVLVDGQGMTLYVLSADGMNHATCDAQCLQFWPAVAPGGASKLKAASGQTTTPDGTAIATVGGHPVYTFSLDKQPGDVKGEGVNEFGGTWHAASPTGTPVTQTAQAPSGGSSSTSTGRGYSY
jgi:predicted lipoprotein with Yx(FWY)xxD motif